MIDSGTADLPAGPLVARNEDSDAALPERGRERLRALADAHFDFIWRSLRRLGVPDEGVDDAAQQVFLVALRRIDEMAPGRERAFLFSHRRRRCRHRWRRAFALHSSSGPASLAKSATPSFSRAGPRDNTGAPDDDAPADAPSGG